MDQAKLYGKVRFCAAVSVVCVSGFPAHGASSGAACEPWALAGHRSDPRDWLGSGNAAWEQGLSLPALLVSGSCWRAPVSIPAGKGLMYPASDLKYLLA